MPSRSKHITQRNGVGTASQTDRRPDGPTGKKTHIRRAEEVGAHGGNQLKALFTLPFRSDTFPPTVAVHVFPFPTAITLLPSKKYYRRTPGVSPAS